MATIDLPDAADSADGVPVLTLVHPLPGFPDATEFTLVRLDETGTLARLQSRTHEALQFLVVPAAQFFPDYAPVVGDEVATELGVDTAADVLVLLIVHAATSLAETTVNLRAPLLVNLRTRAALQVILDDAALSIAEPLVA